MDLLQTFLNLVMPVFGVCTLVVLWPILTIRSMFLRFFNAIFEENVRGKVVLITGASSGIGEQLSYQYAKKGAVLVLIARRESRLRIVSDRCIKRGAMDVRAISADVSKEEDCKRFIEETVNHYGRLDHLVNTAGMTHSFLVEEVQDSGPLNQIMDIDFWGYVYPTFYGLPHLKRSRGKIVVNASVISWLPYPRMAAYNAAKAAVFNFFETLRIELGSSISGITIVTPGWIESEMTMGKFINTRGEIEVSEAQRDKHVGPAPIAYSEECAKAMLKGTLRNHRYVRFPYWYTTFLLYRVFAPEVLDFLLALVYMVPCPGRKDGAPLSKVLMEIPGMKNLLYPNTIRHPRTKQVKA
ncbi:hypothetical protein GOP47_0016288 [Adiantum capillus-veneris]|uniref:Uncharacterized protein n=1 Tax=Adiantum capillus-veneris TaxID=13818 RepID=A0A9D4ZA54_ADICA|nr:hypothetical protein GOP47_0016288 [Adiantum capillus-veneris]